MFRVLPKIVKHVILCITRLSLAFLHGLPHSPDGCKDALRKDFGSVT